MSLTDFIPTNTPTWGDYFQLLGFGILIIVAVYQVKKHRDAQKKQHTDNLKVQIYENMIQEMEGVSFLKISNTFNILAYEIEHAVKRKDPEIFYYVLPRFDLEAYRSEFMTIQSKLSKFISTMESYEIISPNISLFREYLSLRLITFMSVYEPYMDFVTEILTDPNTEDLKFEDELIIHENFDTESFMEVLEDISRSAREITGNITDIKIEAQNILLSDFFGRKTPLRKPEPDQVLLTSEDEAMLQKVKNIITEISEIESLKYQ